MAEERGGIKFRHLLDSGAVIAMAGLIWHAAQLNAEHEQLKKDVVSVQQELQLRGAYQVKLEMRVLELEVRAGVQPGGTP